jgi:hypothetical protein
VDYAGGVDGGQPAEKLIGKIGNVTIRQLVLLRKLREVIRHVFLHDTSFEETLEAVRSPDFQQGYYVLVLEVLEYPDLA